MEVVDPSARRRVDLFWLSMGAGTMCCLAMFLFTKEFRGQSGTEHGTGVFGHASASSFIGSHKSFNFSILVWALISCILFSKRDLSQNELWALDYNSCSRFKCGRVLVASLNVVASAWLLLPVLAMKNSCRVRIVLHCFVKILLEVCFFRGT